MECRIVILAVVLALVLSAIIIGAGLDLMAGDASASEGPDLTQASATGTSMSGDFAPTKYAATDLHAAPSGA